MCIDSNNFLKETGKAGVEDIQILNRAAAIASEEVP